MEALTPASPGDLPPLGELVADEPLWRHPAWGLAREGVRICVSGRPRPIPRATWQLSPRPASEPMTMSYSPSAYRCSRTLPSRLPVSARKALARLMVSRMFLTPWSVQFSRIT